VQMDCRSSIIQNGRRNSPEQIEFGEERRLCGGYFAIEKASMSHPNPGRGPHPVRGAIHSARIVDLGRGSIEEIRIANANEMVWITVADLDADGDSDLATMDEFRYGFHLLFNNGDGTFVQEDPDYTVNLQARYVTAGDLNGDSIPEILVLAGAALLVFA
jgi:hypothetical protein